MLEVVDDRRSSDKITDESDMASRAEARAIMDAMDAQKAKMMRRMSDDFDGIHCIDCGEKIPSERVKLLSYRIPASKNTYPHKSDKKDAKTNEIIKHGTDRCVYCEEFESLRRKRFKN